MANPFQEALERRAQTSPAQSAGLRPFKPGERVENPDGTYSTELTVTVPVGDRWVNAPSLWMSDKGPVTLSEDQVVEQIRQYESKTGESFPTFPSLNAAVTAAEQRSARGGATQGSITQTAGAPTNPFAAALAVRQQAAPSRLEQTLRGSAAAQQPAWQADQLPQTTPPLRAGQQMPFREALTPEQREQLRQQGMVAASQDEFVQARRQGIAPSGAPLELRRLYQQVPPGMRDEYIQGVVNTFYERDSEGEIQHVPTQWSEGLGRHIYKDPYDGEWRPLDSLGPDLADTLNTLKYIGVPVTASVGAGALGALTGSPAVAGASAVGTDVAISGSMRASDVQDLIDQGYLPEDVSATLEGIKEGGWSLLGNLVGAGAGKLVRRNIAGLDDLPIAADMDRKQVVNMLERWEDNYGASNPDMMNLPLDEKLSMVAKTPAEKAMAVRARALRDNLRRNAQFQQEIVQRDMENRAALQQGFDRFLQTAGARPETPGAARASGLTMDEIYAASRNIIDALEAPARQKMAQYDEALTSAYQEADALAQRVVDDAMDPTQMPTTGMGVIRQAKENFTNTMSAQYDAIGQATGGQKVFDIAPLRQAMSQLQRDLAQDARWRNYILGSDVQGITGREQLRAGRESPGTEDITEALFGETFRRDTSGLMIPDSVRRAQRDDTMFSYDAVNSAIHSVRKRIRELPNTDESRSTESHLRHIENVLTDVRDQGLRQLDPELAANQQALDATYKLGIDVLHRGIGKRIAKQYLEPRPGQAEGLMKPQTFQKLFRGDAGAETIRDIRALEAEDVFHAGGNVPLNTVGLRQNIRQGLLGELRTRLRPETGTGEARVLPANQFNTFMRDYGEAVRYALSPEEVARIDDMSGLQRALRQKENARKEFEQSVMEFPWGSKEILDNPTRLMRETWGTDPTTYGKSQALRQALRDAGDPEDLVNDYQKLILHDMMTKSTAGGQISPVQLEEYVSKHEELLREWFTHRGTNRSGTDFVNNLNDFAAIGRAINGDAGLHFADKNPLMASLNSMARAYVGVFTTPGRVLTAAKQMMGGRSSGKEVDFLLNPGKYLKNQDFYEVLNSPAVRGLNRAGGQYWINTLRDGVSEGEIEAPEPTLNDLLNQ